MTIPEGPGYYTPPPKPEKVDYNFEDEDFDTKDKDWEYPWYAPKDYIYGGGYLDQGFRRVTGRGYFVGKEKWGGKHKDGEEEEEGKIADNVIGYPTEWNYPNWLIRMAQWRNF